ncbi:ABC transporter ATP-binding protein [Microlunatus sp. GCM10028923]|uniref:ABC transporter ATP-binding protein n=1 Tax=Microlunatus sp. GCM10028923 TaxID=3273400 RepID=UPI003617D23A
MTAALTVVNGSVGYAASRRNRAILTGVQASLHAGELACLVGLNGSGKSTLLRSLARFQPLLGGSVEVSGRPLAQFTPRQLARHIAVVLTERAAPGQMRAYDVVALGRYPYTGIAGRLSPADRAVIDDAIAATSAGKLAARPLGELSDGERQRIMIARALAQQPEVLLLDEPAAFLDVRARTELAALLAVLTHDHGLAVLMSTHDLDHTMRYADVVWLIDEARSLTIGAPEDLGRAGMIEKALGGGRDFDPDTGTFAPPASPHRAVALDGDDPLLSWTRRAVIRAGCRIDQEAPIRVSWSAGADPHWTVSSSGRTVEVVDCLGDLVRQVRGIAT